MNEAEVLLKNLFYFEIKQKEIKSKLKLVSTWFNLVLHCVEYKLSWGSAS